MADPKSLALQPMAHTSPHPARFLLSAFQPLRRSTKAGFIASRRDLPKLDGTGFTERMEIQPGLELVLTCYDLRHDLNLHLQVDQPMISFGCVTTGKVSIRGDSLRAESVVQDGDGITMLASEGNYSFKASRGNYHSLSLELSQEFLAKTLAHGSLGEIKVLEEAVSHRFFPSHLGCRPLSLVARSAALGMLTSSREDPLRSLLLESYALTILREQLLSVSPSDRRLSSELAPCPRRQSERLEEVRRLLEQSPAASPKLSELATQVGLNEWSLKKGFRSRFGVTVYDYLRTHRMKVADAMLCSGDYNVNETAAAIGYKNSGRFSIAYRREFGVLPKSRQMFSKRSMSEVAESAGQFQ